MLSSIPFLKDGIPCPQFVLLINHIVDLRILLPSLLIFFYLQSSFTSYINDHKDKIIEGLNAQLTHELVPVEHLKVEVVHKKQSHTNKPKYSEDDYIVKGLTQYTEIGYLPIIRRTDSLTSFRAYQKKFDFSKAPERPVISFLLLDYGLSHSLSETAVDILPPEISFLLSPYSALTSEWMNMAKASGHEVWLNLPIQSAHESNLGEFTLFHHDPLPEKQNKMRALLAKTQGYAGVVSYTDAQLDIVDEQYSEIADEIYLRGLGYIEMNTKPSPIFASRSLVGGMSAPYLRADMRLENILGTNNDFDKLEKLAKQNGYVLVLVPNYPKIVKQLDVWLEKIAKHDYVLAPVSALYDLPLHREVVLNNGEIDDSDDHNKNGH